MDFGGGVELGRRGRHFCARDERQGLEERRRGSCGDRCGIVSVRKFLVCCCGGRPLTPRILLVKENRRHAGIPGNLLTTRPRSGPAPCARSALIDEAHSCNFIMCAASDRSVRMLLILEYCIRLRPGVEPEITCTLEQQGGCGKRQAYTLQELRLYCPQDRVGTCVQTHRDSIDKGPPNGQPINKAAACTTGPRRLHICYASLHRYLSRIVLSSMHVQCLPFRSAGHGNNTYR
jgi:hypothetical protein